MKMMKATTTLAVAFLAGAPAVSVAAVGSIQGSVQAVDEERVLDATGAWVMLCDGPGLTCREVARQKLNQSMSSDGLGGPYKFTGQTRAYKVRVWRDNNGNGVVDDGDLEGWYREGLGDPVPVQPAGHTADVIAYVVGSARWREENGIGMGRITGAIELPGYDAVNQTQIVACVQSGGRCDRSRTFHGWVEDFDGSRGRYVIEAPSGTAYTVFAWIDADGDGVAGSGERATLVAPQVRAPAAGINLRLQPRGGTRLPALSSEE